MKQYIKIGPNVPALTDIEFEDLVIEFDRDGTFKVIKNRYTQNYLPKEKLSDFLNKVIDKSLHIV
jgi:hypothetical protein